MGLLCKEIPGVFACSHFTLEIAYTVSKLNHNEDKESISRKGTAQILKEFNTLM